MGNRVKGKASANAIRAAKVRSIAYALSEAGVVALTREIVAQYASKIVNGVA
ncbi:MAG: hypothetical protein PHW73_08145 [Atribacterota bacterium]|nr:hypothetical protein [Atribacterota bacterium]